MEREFSLMREQVRSASRNICGHFVEFWRSLDVAAIRPDFVGSKREMSPNRARQHISIELVSLFESARIRTSSGYFLRLSNLRFRSVLGSLS
jgi:hypothetical protein